MNKFLYDNWELLNSSLRYRLFTILQRNSLYLVELFCQTIKQRVFSFSALTLVVFLCVNQIKRLWANQIYQQFKTIINLKMHRSFLVALVIVQTFATTLPAHMSPSHLSTLKTTHQISVESPCDDDETVVANPLPPTINGCGSSGWSVKLAKMLSPYIKYLTPCCNEHDKCYGTCAVTNFEDAFKKCNNDFKDCMTKVCVEVEGNHWAARQLCKANAGTFYEIVKNLGPIAYNNSQKNHCDCV